MRYHMISYDHLRTSLRLPVETTSFNSQRGQKRSIDFLMCLYAFNVATLMYDSWWIRLESNQLRAPGLTLHSPMLLTHMAEEERLELSRHLAMTYRFSKPAPSPTWVLLHIVDWPKDSNDVGRGRIRTNFINSIIPAMLNARSLHLSAC